MRRQVAVIVTPGSTVAAHAAKAATTTIPIVYYSGVDPVESGLIAGLNRPGGNVTGIYLLSVDFVAKRLGLLHELVPAVTTIAVLVNPAVALVAELTTKEAQVAARSLGLEIKVFPAKSLKRSTLIFRYPQAGRPITPSIGTSRHFAAVPKFRRYWR